jgi:hypothetical protein
MTSNPTPRGRAEGLVLTLILLTVAGFAGAASFTHVHDWTMTNSPAGTPGWFGWANAVISELVPIAALLTIRQRRRTAAPIGYPMTLLACSAGLSLAAQLAVAKPGPSGWLLSAVPAVAFMALAKLVLAPITASAPSTMDNPATEPVPAMPKLVGDTTVTGDGPASAAAPTAPELPVRLLPTARFAVVNHEQHHGRPITVDELADRLAVTTAIAGQLLTTINPPATTPARVDGASTNGASLNGATASGTHHSDGVR